MVGVNGMVGWGYLWGEGGWEGEEGDGVGGDGRLMVWWGGEGMGMGMGMGIGEGEIWRIVYRMRFSVRRCPVWYTDYLLREEMARMDHKDADPILS